jgi:hypothetical protein
MQRMSTWTWKWIVLVALAVAAAGTGACHDSCGQHGSPCGRDPTGSWSVLGSCRDPSWSPPRAITTLNQPETVARESAAPDTSSDWCSGLVYGVGGVTDFIFAYDTLSVSGGSVTYAGDSSYQLTLNTQGTGRADLPLQCISRFGTPLSCDDLAAGLTMVAAAKPAKPAVRCTDDSSEPVGCDFFKTFDGIQCAPDGQQGCACTYNVHFAGSYTGQWKMAGGNLVQTDQLKALPFTTDYCVDGGAGSLTLWSHNQAPLFDEPGLGELLLRRQ